MEFIKKYWMPLTLLAGGLASRFLFIWWPKEVVFDEVHFGKFVSGYFNHEYFFDIHPPLGKLLIALAAHLGGFNAGFSFDEIGRGYGAIPYIALRFLPNLAGALIPVAALWLFLQLGLSKRGAFLGGALLLLDNALLVQSHFILVDAFLVLFGLFGAVFFLRSRATGYSWKWLIGAGIFLGLSMSVKWTGLSIVAGAVVLSLWDFATGESKNIIFSKQFNKKETVRPKPELVKPIVSLCLIPLAVYVAVFWVHFSLLTKPGPGDPFMRQGFQQRNFIQKFLELNLEMYSANATLNATHPYASKFYTWPAMIRPVYYWVKTADNKTARIYLLGNPVVWWLSTVLGIVSIFGWRPKDRLKKWGLGTMWFLNVVPFVFIGRVVFLYHYLLPLIFAVGLLAGWVSEVPKARAQSWWFYGLLSLALAGFVFFAPISYGFFLSDAHYKWRVWLGSWI